MSAVIAPRFAGIDQFERCVAGARMTPDGFDKNGDLTVDGPNDPDAVGAIQRALRDLGYPVDVTLAYDDATAAAVRKFKIDQRLAVPAGMTQHDGVVGPGTSGRLNALFTPAPTVVPPPTPVPASPALQAWERLISFRPAGPMQAALNARFGLFSASRVVHAIEDAKGPVNLDFYPVRVSAMPTEGGSTMTAEKLLEFVRRNFNNFVDGPPNGCVFQPYEPLVDTAAWLPPLLPTAFPGAVLSIDMFSSGVNVDDGAVVAAEVAADHWVFSTLWTPDDGGHPVSGNREFGYTAASAGEFVFYARGADRTTAALDSAMSTTVFGAAHQLWLSFQRRLAAFVNGNGGLATIESPTSDRYDWPTVRSAHHHPTTAWVR
ncbi:peptidoglycan-binding domain-containing protein [Micromonospora sp. WMMD1082]|uniref:peptidoglycan-binding domain-containing protein n=1 Tax=Micromonospora sp. WMMD1082 TaxID=3016104 RepID=UPI0024161FF4|nr:peptidoglycan-binding domain-containing protein [Micromonospora sp. WMMD1082]MDG4798155.1 peptidoglycan-binding domain-containing protein [Micromonospora sp. WMMD1082]